MNLQLNREMPIPLYYQVFQILQNEILRGSSKPGDLFGTEQELQEKFNVSRATIRKALEQLEAEDLIFRVTGKGIFIAPVKLKIDLPQLLSFSEEMKRRGMRPGTRLLGVETMHATDSITEQLALRDNREVLLVRRIRLGDETPIVITESYIPATAGLTEKSDFEGSLYELFQQASGRAVDQAKHTVEAAVADPETAEYLEVEAGFPLLKFKRVAFDSQARPVIYETGLARADKYSYEIWLKR